MDGVPQTARASLIVHGGAGAVPEDQRAPRQAAVERALEAGWAALGQGALAAAVAAVRVMEDEPVLNAGIGAVLNADGVAELDAGVMEGTGLGVGAVGAVTDVRHPVELARAVLEDGRHTLLVAGGASRFAREHGLELADPSLFVTDRRRQQWEGGDTVGAVACDAEGRLAAAVSTGGRLRKLPGRVGDSPLAGAGFYARDGWGAAVGTGEGEAFVRLVLCHLACVELTHGMAAQEVADGAIRLLEERLGAQGGIILLDAEGAPAAAYNTLFMPWATRQAT